MISLWHTLFAVMCLLSLQQQIQANTPFHILKEGGTTKALAFYNEGAVSSEEWQPISQNNWLILRTTAATKQQEQQLHKLNKQRTHSNSNRQHQQPKKHPSNYYAYTFNNKSPSNGGGNKRLHKPPTSPKPLLTPSTTTMPSSSAMPYSNGKESTQQHQQESYLITLNNLLRADILARQQLPVPLPNERNGFVMQSHNQEQHQHQHSFNDSKSVDIDSVKKHKSNIDLFEQQQIDDSTTKKNANDKEIVPVNAKQQPQQHMDNELFVPLENVLNKIEEFCGIAKQIIADVETDDNDDDDDDDSAVDKDGIDNGNAESAATSADIDHTNFQLVESKVHGQYNMPVTMTTPARALSKTFGTTWTSSVTARKKVKKYKKKFKKFLLPLLIAYKLKFLTLVPVLIGGLTLLVGTTGLAGFFFALFTAVMSLKGSSHSKSFVFKNL